VILVDAGPLIAMIDADDQHHEECQAVAAVLREPLVTVWPAVTEAMYMLDTYRRQDRLWELLNRPVLHVAELIRQDFSDLRRLMKKYEDLPMDLADAALVRVAEREGINRIFTLDRRDFQVYRVNGKKFEIVP
jgi:predicted nucleic acid-binding protein